MKPIRNSAKAVIIEDGKLLTIKNLDEEGFWYILPGGGQEPGESLPDTLRRECLEEINSEVVVGNLLFVRDYISRNHEFALSEPDVHAVDLMFSCRLAAGADVRSGATPDSMQVGVEWLELDKLDSYRFYPLGLRPLMKHYKDKGTPIYLGDIN